MPDDAYFDAAAVPDPARLPQRPAPLPSVPCLVYAGRRIQWEPWRSAPLVLCSKVDQSCDACTHPGPGVMAFGKELPHDGETKRVAVKVGTQPSGRPLWKGRDVPVRAMYRLAAHLCPSCLDLTVHDLNDRDGTAPVQVLLCDGCDRACSVGQTLDEARTNLLELGGWTAGGDADWDLCPACNPATSPEVPPRALAVMEESRGHAARPGR